MTGLTADERVSRLKPQHQPPAPHQPRDVTMADASVAPSATWRIAYSAGDRTRGLVEGAEFVW